MFACAPFRSAAGEIIGAIGFRLRPEEGFTDVLQIARMGKSGETYAFDKTGLMLSQSRFDEQLKDVGLLSGIRTRDSVLSLILRDPGVDLTRGNDRRKRRPSSLSSARREASQGKTGTVLTDIATIVASRKSEHGLASTNTKWASMTKSITKKPWRLAGYWTSPFGRCLDCWWRCRWRF